MPPTIAHVADFLEGLAPLALAEQWDNVGLLAGDPARPAERIMTCLTISASTADESVRRRADLVVVHHPLPFEPLTRLAGPGPGGLVWRLASAGVAIYSLHTAFDSAERGINQRLAEGLGLGKICPMVSRADGLPGVGRAGWLATACDVTTIANRLKAFLKIEHIQCVGDADAKIERVGVACGSAGELIEPAARIGCQCLVTGEARFHACLQAESLGLVLLLAGHYASERFGMDALAALIGERFADATVWASEEERDPVAWV